MSRRKSRKARRIVALALAGIAALAVYVFMPGGYSESHPYLFHNCARLASLCPSHYAVWAPPGGTDPSSRYIYGACACAASITVHGG